MKKQNPNADIILEAAGSSRMCARKISLNLHQPCDLMNVMLHYTVIQELLIPEYASWYIQNDLNQRSQLFIQINLNMQMK